MRVKKGVRVEYWDRRRGEYVIKQRIFHLTDGNKPIKAQIIKTKASTPKWTGKPIDKRELEKVAEKVRKAHEQKLKEVLKE